MQQEGWELSRVEKTLRSTHERDHKFADGAILGSMCTQPNEAALLAHELFAETNLGDPDHFPGTAQLEAEVIADALALTNAPAEAGGRFLTGGTEANLFAMYVAREKTGKRTVVLPEHAHFSFEKAARMLGMNLHWVPSAADHRADVAAMMAVVNEDTALVVAVAGSTELGLVDPIQELSAECAEAGVLLHIDGAFGGYVLPFLPNAPALDFALPGVWSVSLDPHKMGQSTIPSGMLLLRAEADWEHVAVETPYVSTPRQSQLLGTRPGAAAAATWAAHRALGRNGYAAAARRCLMVRDRLVEGLTGLGLSLVAPPELNVVTFKVPDAQATMTMLDKAGLRVNIIPRFNAIRIVVGPHVTEVSVKKLISALDNQ